MLTNSHVPVLLAAIALAFPALAQAAKFSELTVVQEAVQAGMWTTTTVGTLPDGTVFPAKKETSCITKAQLINILDNPFMWNSKTGEENRDCPTTLTTNTSNLGVASMSCKGQTLLLAGQSVTIPAIVITTEFKRINKQTWAVKTGDVVTTVLYHGAATAACTPNL